MMASDDRLELRGIENISSSDMVKGTSPASQYSKGKNQEQKRKQKKVKDFFNPLSKAVEASNKRLIARKLPYRFRVFREDEDVFIELSILDEGGNIIKKEVKNITESDFNRIID
ncbi:MAG: hypothetical protein N2053_09760, partial [Chitinispirillaceae bacterium]|nr:hypothetical protein [Chitinispirillaceae bacterium]